MNIKSFTVLPATPEKLKPLEEMAYNLWFSWNEDATELFSRLDAEIWRQSNENPIVMLSLTPREKLEAASQDAAYMISLDAVYSRYKRYMGAQGWHEKTFGPTKKPNIAYFCCEYGIHESLPIYSGGLGVLSGDHLKSASDLGIPLVAVGLLYKMGYFKQYLNADGMQQEDYLENSWYNLPVKLVRDEAGKEIVESVAMGADTVSFRIWEAKVGRVSLFLLDTDLPQNDPRHQGITTRLYDSDRDVRIRQEILLGIGGLKALRRLEFEPEVCHINEGHSAFLLFERLRRYIHEKKLSFQEAAELVRASNVFTTHTPVPAGNERFHPDLIRRYFEPAARELGLEWHDFLALGREFPDNAAEEFCMTVLALKFSHHANGVAKLHGVVSRDMWKNLYPDVPVPEVPIGHVTNGIHTRTWLSRPMRELFKKYAPKVLDGDMLDPKDWDGLENVGSSELWALRNDRRNVLVRMAREKIKEQLKSKWATAGELSRVDEFLDPAILTIGFARRFATYKRGNLILRNSERLLALLRDAKRPMQFLIAGKAHPADIHGKEVIKTLVNFAQTHDVAHRIVFLENYDLRIARYLVQGVDVWLNNPRRPMEASGTSGMKAAVNGVPNLSILDGWWDEAYTQEVGWAIGQGEEYEDSAYQDSIESDLLYRNLEHSVVPLFYTRGSDGVPEGWVKMMKASMRLMGHDYSTHRMVADYARGYYQPAAQRYAAFRENEHARLKEYAARLEKLRRGWHQVKFVGTGDWAGDEIKAGGAVEVIAKLDLGPVAREDVSVEVVHGATDAHGRMQENAYRDEMVYTGQDGNVHLYSTRITPNLGGRYGYGVRVVPRHEPLATPFASGLIRWS